MPPKDEKPAKPRREVKEEEDDDDEKSLGSIALERKKKQPTKSSGNANGTAKSTGREAAKVKKEDKMDQDWDKATKAKPKQEARVKKEENGGDSNEELGLKPRKGSNSKPQKEIKDNKVKKMEEEEEEKGKKRKASEAATEEKKKREKKVYDLPGQKKDPPEKKDPLRQFYESLHEQIPSSEMAQFWMMEYGLLPKVEAEKVFEKKQKKSQLQKLTSPTKSVSSVKTSTKSVTVKKNTPSPAAPSNNKKPTTVSKSATNQSKKQKTEDSSSERDSDDDFVARIVKKKQAA
ncbi:transcriptional regulator ATRX homolog [Pyrus x bretschneideri]|uniref:transcriptional regulator ATRX homolog n=1 Tax=Pyrus x bretschneideri TaxID=225117 RepID=UPI00203038F8|nr:transcriptional regulator ATRX homolog [Pyrus x bretschneideri]